MTNAELDELERLGKEARCMPWTHDEITETIAVEHVNAAFILAARTNWQSLIDEIRRLMEREQKWIAVARPIVKELQDIGDDMKWSMGDETDRVYPWYEISPLAEMLTGRDMSG